jgi:hypothetical protein
MLFLGKVFCAEFRLCRTNSPSLMMCQSADDLRLQAHWDGARGESRTQLLSELSSRKWPSCENYNTNVI